MKKALFAGGDDLVENRRWDLPFVRTVDDFRIAINYPASTPASPTQVQKWLNDSPLAEVMPEDLRKQVNKWLAFEIDLLQSKIDLPSIRPGGRSGATRRLRTGARRGALALEPYDPDARDADGDGIVQEGTAWERPATARILDALGNEIRRGQQASVRPTGIRVVDRDGNDIDYKPTYEGGRAGTIGGSTIPEVRPSVKPPEALTPEKPAKKAAAKKPAKPKKETPLADHGARSLKERGLPSAREQYRAATTPPEPEAPEVPEAPEPKTPKAKKPKETPVVDDIALSPGVTLASADRPELEKPEKPRSPFKPSPPPLEGRAQELADEADGDFKKFMELLDKEGYVVFDYETTGLQDGNIPVQIGAVRIKDGKIVERFNVFTNPQRPLSDWSKENLKDKDGNPLTDEWLQGQTDLAEAHRQLAEFLGDSIIVAHNLPYDGEIIDRMMKDADIDYKPSGSIDTLMLLRSAVPKGDGESGPERHTLGSLADFFDVDLGDAAHTADADSEAAALVLQKAMNWSGDNDSSPDIFDAAKQKELFDAATKKYNDDRKKYEVALKQYQADLADYERAVTRADEPEVPSKPKTQAIVPKSENATRLNTYRQQFQDMVFDWINQRDDSWKKVDGLRVRKYGEDEPQRTVSIDVTRSGSDGPAKAKMSTAKMIKDGWADRGIDPSEELKSNYKVIINKDGGEVVLAYVGERKTDVEVLSGWKGKGDWYEIDEKDDRYRDLFNQAVASVLIGHWAGNKTNEVDKGIKKLFGGNYRQGDSFATRGGGAVGDDIAESFVEIMYEDTQKMFASMGIKEVQLHRGMALDYESPHGKAVAAKIREIVEAASEEQIDEWSREGLQFKMEKVRTELRAASSFSSDPFVADAFAEGEDEGPPIGVFSGAVPVERILATPATGIGCLNEDEMVVIGGEDTDFEVDIQVNDLQRVLRSINRTSSRN
jgi:DNA polymerase III epsilon subunit-like protein